jgi:dihydroneopterin aldolase
MDTVFISGLRIETRIGVYEWEQRGAQTIELDLEVGLPGHHVVGRDQLQDTIDYASVVARVERLFRDQHFSLLEHAAESVAAAVRHDFSAPWIRVSIAKLAPLRNVKQLGVVIERGTRP